MTTKEIFSAETANTDKIILYKEGIFYKAYEKSAYAFVLRKVKHLIHTITADNGKEFAVARGYC